MNAEYMYIGTYIIIMYRTMRRDDQKNNYRIRLLKIVPLKRDVTIIIKIIIIISEHVNELILCLLSMNATSL